MKRGAVAGIKKKTAGKDADGFLMMLCRSRRDMHGESFYF